MNRMRPRALSRNGWSKHHLIQLAVLCGVGTVLMQEAWLDIFHLASGNEESYHIFLVPFIFVWLFWVRRERFRYCKPANTWLGPLLVLLGWAISTFGYYNAVESFWHGGAVLVWIGCVAAVMGRDVLVRFAPAFLVLVFLVPVPGRFRLPAAMWLQEMMAHVTQASLSLFGVPIQAEGNLLTINQQPVAVAEACNGMRMVFMLILVSYGFAFGTPLRNYVRLLIVGASPILALVCNVIRMLPTVLMYGYASQEAADLFHELAPWGMLLIAMGLLLGVVRSMQWAMFPVTKYNLAYDR